jgi:hypothetical protein
VAVLERIDESRLAAFGAPLSFIARETRSNPHAIGDGQQAMSNDSREKRPQKQILPFLGWFFA